MTKTLTNRRRFLQTKNVRDFVIAEFLKVPQGEHFAIDWVHAIKSFA